MRTSLLECRGRCSFYPALRMTLLLLTLATCLVGCASPFDVTAGGQQGPESDSKEFQVPASIAADCSTDVTASLQAWFASVPDSSTLVFGKNACYNIDGGLVIVDRHSLTFEGNGSTFRVFSRGTRDRANWTFKSGSKLTLKSMIARGANPHAGLFDDAYDTNVEGQHAYRIEGTQGVVLDSVEAYDVWGDFVEMEPDWRYAVAGQAWEPVRDVVVRNSRFDRNGRMGIGPTNVDGFTLEDSYIGNVRWSAIDIELDDSHEVGRNITIQRNHFGPIMHHMLTAQGTGTSASVGNIVVRGNVMDADAGTCLPAIVMETPSRQDLAGGPIYWTGWTIEDNSLQARTGGWSVQLTRAKNVSIKNNKIISRTHGGCSQTYTVRLIDSHEIAVTNNTLSELGDSGHWWTTILFADSLTTGLNVSGNVIATSP